MNHSAELGAWPFSCISFYSLWDVIIITNKYISKLDHNRFFQLKGKKIILNELFLKTIINAHFIILPSPDCLSTGPKSQVTLLSNQHHCGWLCDPDLFTLQGLLFPNGKIRNFQKFIFKLPSFQVTQMVKKKRKKEKSACNSGATDVGSIFGLGRSPEGGHDNALQFSCLENSMDRGAWWATIHGGHKRVRQD